MGMDPVAPNPEAIHSFNRYAYANNNPYKFVDPDGRLPILAPVVIFLAKEVAAEALSEMTSGLSDYISIRGLGKKGLSELSKGFAEDKLGQAVRQGSMSWSTISKGESEARSLVSGIKLKKQLANEQQLSEVGTPVAGAGTRTVLRDTKRLANEYGGNDSDWQKRSSSQYIGSDGRGFETHWYENSMTGQRVEQKTIIENYLKGSK